MSDRTRSPGDVVEARCTRCRTVTNHTIVALVGSTIARVQCNTCGGSHNYHAPQAPAAPRSRAAAAPKAPAKSRTSPDLGTWLERCSTVEPAAAAPYAMDRAFVSGSLVAHPSFGVGLVTAVLPPNKVEILFRDGRKLLRCAG